MQAEAARRMKNIKWGARHSRALYFLSACVSSSLARPVLFIRLGVFLPRAPYIFHPPSCLRPSRALYFSSACVSPSLVRPVFRVPTAARSLSHRPIQCNRTVCRTRHSVFHKPSGQVISQDIVPASRTTWFTVYHAPNVHRQFI